MNRKTVTMHPMFQLCRRKNQPVTMPAYEHANEILCASIHNKQFNKNEPCKNFKTVTMNRFKLK